MQKRTQIFRYHKNLVQKWQTQKIMENGILIQENNLNLELKKKKKNLCNDLLDRYENLIKTS